MSSILFVISAALNLGSIFFAIYFVSEDGLPLLLCLVICAAANQLTLVTPGRSMANIMFWGYWQYGFLLPGILQLSGNRFFWPAILHYRGFLGAYSGLLILVFLVLVLFFSRGPGRGLKPDAVLPARGPEPDAVLPGPLHVTLSFWVVAAIIIAAIFAYFPFERESAFTIGYEPEDLVETGLRTTLPREMFLGLAAITMLLIKRNWRSASTAARLMLLVLFGVIVSLYPFISSPTVVTRFATVSVSITLMLIFLQWPLSSALKGRIAIGLPVAVLILMPLLRLLRYQENLREATDVLGFMYSADLDGLQSVMNVVWYNATSGHTDGNEILSALLFFIPRSLWSGKGLGTGHAPALAAGYPHANVSSPLPIEFYSDFSLIGLIFAAYLCGKALRWLDDPGAKGKTSDVIRILAISYIPIILRGSLLGIVAPIACQMATAILLTWTLSATAKIRSSPALDPSEADLIKRTV